MTALSDEFRAAASEIIALFGSDHYKIRRVTPTYPDLDNPTTPVMETQVFPCRAALISFTEEQIKMNPVLREDKQAIIEWNENLPKRLLPGDEFLDNDMVYKIVPPEDVYSVNGVTIAWRALVRG